MSLISLTIPFFDWKSVMLVIIVFVLILIFNRRQVSTSNFPPGPRGWPYIGNILSLAGEAPHETLMNMAEKFGNVMGLQLGMFPTVVLTDYESIKEAFVKSGDKFSDRPKITLYEEFSKGQGIVGGYLENGVKERRRFALTVLRRFGMGKKTFEEKINEEIGAFVKHIKKTFPGVAFNPLTIINTSVSNVTCSIIFGHRFNYDDPTFLKMLYNVHRIMELAANASAMNFLPFLKYLPNTAINELRSIYLKFKEFQLNIFKEHMADYDPENPRDFIDAYRTEIEKNNEQDTGSSFDEDSMFHVIADLFVAGTETTSTTLLWALLYMSLHQNIQQKVQDELDKVVGAGNHPTKAHLPRLPYTEAVLLEIQRMGAIAPLGVPHAAVEDTTFRGYDIKKGTIVIPNMFAVLRDPKVWTNPDVFDPNRFLDDDNQVIRREELIPFCIGRRACLGEQLAKTELYLFFANIMLNFNIKRPKNSQPPNLRGKIGATRIPHSFEVMATSRCRPTVD